jgi:hypothetical protein
MMITLRNRTPAPVPLMRYSSLFAAVASEAKYAGSRDFWRNVYMAKES